MPEPTSTSRSADRTAEFLRLLSKQERRLMAMILAMVPDWSAAEDICQEVRIRLWNEFERYDPTRDFGAWSRTIAYYEVLSYRKRQLRQPHAFSDEFFDAIAAEMQRLPDDQAERQRALGLCLQKLSELNRGVLARYYKRGESLREIAASLGRSFDATRQMVLRTRKALGKCIEQTLKGEHRHEPSL